MSVSKPGGAGRAAVVLLVGNGPGPELFLEHYARAPVSPADAGDGDFVILGPGEERCSTRRGERRRGVLRWGEDGRGGTGGAGRGVVLGRVLARRARWHTA